MFFIPSTKSCILHPQKAISSMPYKKPALHRPIPCKLQGNLVNKRGDDCDVVNLNEQRSLNVVKVTTLNDQYHFAKRRSSATSLHHHIVRLQLQRRKRIFACQKAKKKGVEENRTTSGTKIPLVMIITTPYIIQDWTVQ